MGFWSCICGSNGAVNAAEAYKEKTENPLGDASEGDSQRRDSLVASLKLKNETTGLFNELEKESRQFVAKQLSLDSAEGSSYEDDELLNKFKAIVLNGSVEHEEEEVLVTKQETRSMFEKIKLDIPIESIDRFFTLFDVENSGKVDLFALTLAFCFFSNKQMTRDSVELAFRLFDTDHDGKITKGQLNAMIASILGNKLDSVFSSQTLKTAFIEFTESEFSGELVRFLEYVDKKAEEFPGALPIDEAQTLYDRFMKEGAEEQVNISDDARETCRLEIEKSTADGKVSHKFLDTPVIEARRMLEQGCLPRFKTALRKSTLFIADRAWPELEIKSHKNMDLEKFKKWSSDCPHLFSVFSTLQEEFNGKAQGEIST